MNPAKRKWLARLEEAAKKEVVAVKQEEAAPQPVVEAPAEQPVVQEVVEVPPVVEEAPAPVASNKKKKS